MQFTNEYYAVVSHFSPIMELAKIYIRKKAAYLSAEYIETKINEREKIGDTYVGNRTIVLHVISEKVTQPFVMYLFLSDSEIWKSLYSNKDYQIDKVMIAVVNPKQLDLSFKFFPKFFDCEPEKLLKATNNKKDKIYQFL